MPSIAMTALSGMHAAQTRLAASAHNIANLETEGFHRQTVSQRTPPAGGTLATVDTQTRSGHAIEADVVGLLQARNHFLANLAVFKTGDQMTGSLLDALG